MLDIYSITFKSFKGTLKIVCGSGRQAFTLVECYNCENLSEGLGSEQKFQKSSLESSNEIELIFDGCYTIAPISLYIKLFATLSI